MSDKWKQHYKSFTKWVNKTRGRNYSDLKDTYFPTENLKNVKSGFQTFLRYCYFAQIPLPENFRTDKGNIKVR